MDEDLPQAFGEHSGLIADGDVGDQLLAFKEHDEFEEFDDAHSSLSDGMESYAAAQTVFARKGVTVQQYERYLFSFLVMTVLMRSTNRKWNMFLAFLASRHKIEDPKQLLEFAFNRDIDTPKRIISFICKQCEFRDTRNKHGKSLNCEGHSVFFFYFYFFALVTIAMHRIIQHWTKHRWVTSRSFLMVIVQ